MAVRTVTIALTGSSAQLQAALRDAGLTADTTAEDMSTSFSVANDKMAASSGKLSGIFAGLFGAGNPISKGLDAISSKFKGADGAATTFGSKLQGVGAIATVGLGVAVVGVGVAAVKMASQFDDAQAQVKVAVDNAGASWGKNKDAIDKAENSLAKYGFNSTQVAQVLPGLIMSTGKVSTATKDLSTAADLARAKNISLSTASSDLQKVYAGSSRVLTSLGLNLDVGTGKLKTIQSATQSLQGAQITLKNTQEKVADGTLKGVAANQAMSAAQRTVSLDTQKLRSDQSAVGDIITAVTNKTKGAAGAFGNTLSGQVDKAKASFHNIFTELGEKLIPIVTRMAGILADFVTWLTNHQTVFLALAAVIGTVLVVAIGAFVAGMVTAAAASAATAATAVIAFGSMVVAAAPILLPIAAIVAALVAVGVGIDLLVTHWSTVWGAIQNAVQVVVSAITGMWNTLWSDITGLVDSAVGFITSHWQTILQILLGPIGAAWAGWQKFGGDITSFFSAIPGAIGKVFSGLGEVISAPFKAGWQILKGILNDIINGINSLINGYNKIPFLPNVPDLPHLAVGTKDFKGGLAMVGERGPELVYLPGHSQVVPNNQLGEHLGTGSSPVAAPGGSSGHQITVIANSNASPHDIASEIGWKLRVS